MADSKAKRPPVELRRFGRKLSQLNELSFIDDEKRGVGYKIWQIVEVLLVILLIFLAWGLLSLPVIFYYIDIQEMSPQNANSTDISTMGTPPEGTDLDCLNPFQYDLSDQRCHSELLDALSESDCPHESGQSITVVRNGQELANQIVLGLEFVRASESCLVEATSVLCLYAYGLCSSSGVYIQPTSSKCEELRDSLCQTEWASALSFGVNLPNCNDLPSTLASCSALDETNSNITLKVTAIDDKDNPIAPSAMPLECSDGYYRENGSQICIPSCYSWHQYERRVSLAFDVVICLSAVIGGIAGILILIIAGFRPKKVCRFPAILVLYMALDTLVLEILVMVTYVDRSGLYCSTESLLDSLQRVTPYCVITGIFFAYIIFQLAVWWLLHILVMFWMVFFPFQSQRYRTSRKLKYIHAVCFIIGLLLPLTTVIASMSEFGVQSRNNAENGTSATDLFLSGGLGYSSMRFPPILCSPSDGNVAFYSLILPLDIIQAVGSTVLLILLWRIHRQSLNKSRNLPSLFQFGTAEKKLLLIFFYFEILSSIALITFTLNTRYDVEFAQSVFELFLCEQRGHDPENPCSRSDINRLGFPAASIVSYIILGLFAVVIIVYALDIEEIKRKFIKSKSTRRNKQTTSFNSSIDYTKNTSFNTSLSTK